MNAKDFESKVSPLFENSGFDLVDVKFSGGQHKPLIQVFVDRESGSVSHGDCQEWSDKIGAMIDMDNILDGGYILEVSSPGVDRLIKTEKDFRKFSGSSVKITLKRPVEGSRVYYSRITGFENASVLFEDGLRFLLEEIQEVRINPNYDELLKKNHNQD